MHSVTFTANARPLGARQADALQRIQGSFGAVDGIVAWQDIVGAFQGRYMALYNATQSNPTTAMRYPNINFDSSLVTRSASETRPVNVAYHPRIHA